MSTIAFNGVTIRNAGYLVRALADLSGAHLELLDLDVHVVAQIDNHGADELAAGEVLAGTADLIIQAYDDGVTTHRFGGIAIAERIVARTPRTMVAAMRFRYGTQQVDGTTYPGWVDFENRASRVRCIFPKVHGAPPSGEPLYPPVTLPDKAKVHAASLAGEEPKRPDVAASPEIVENQPRLLLGFFLTEQAQDGKLVPTRIGLDSYRTNSCRWLDLLTHQDSHWQCEKAQRTGSTATPLRLTVANPGGKGGVAFNLCGKGFGTFLYAESGGNLASAGGVIRTGDDRADRWSFAGTDPASGSSAPGVLPSLQPIALAQVPNLIPLNGRDLSAGGMPAIKGAHILRPVERVVITLPAGIRDEPAPPVLAGAAPAAPPAIQQEDVAKQRVFRT